MRRTVQVGDCQVWTGSTHSFGYGWIRLGGRKGRTLLVHRVAYEERHGPIPDGLFVLHRCDNPPCVADEHLFLGTAADNAHDMCSKGRHWSQKAEP
jgi:hypothetical protein